MKYPVEGEKPEFIADKNKQEEKAKAPQNLPRPCAFDKHDELIKYEGNDSDVEKRGKNRDPTTTSHICPEGVRKAQFPIFLFPLKKGLTGKYPAATAGALFAPL